MKWNRTYNIGGDGQGLSGRIYGNNYCRNLEHASRGHDESQGRGTGPKCRVGGHWGWSVADKDKLQ